MHWSEEMYSDMRRKDRQISDEEAKELLKKGEYGFLATVDSENQPYVIPVSYVIMDNQILVHCAKQGKKLDNIQNEPKVCFSVVGETQPALEKKNNFTTYFESVVVFGKAYLINDNEVKEKALYNLCEKYLPEHMDKAKDAVEMSFKATEVFAISMDHITGKAKRPLK